MSAVVPVVAAYVDAGRRHGGGRVRLDAQERVAHTNQQSAGEHGAVHGVRYRPGPEFHQAGRTQEPAQGTRADIHHASGHNDQHRAVPPAAAHRTPDHGPPVTPPEPHRGPGIAVQVIRHAHLHQGVLVRHILAATKLQTAQDKHFQTLRDTSHYRHETTDAHAYRSVTIKYY